MLKISRPAFYPNTPALFKSNSMGQKDNKELHRFISPYPKQVQEIALWLRDFVWNLYPDANELIYDNYNAVAFGWSPTEKLSHTFCSVALMPRYCHFGFYWGSQIADPKKILQGKGNQYRYVKVENCEEFPVEYIKKLLKDAWANSMLKVKDGDEMVKGKTIVKSISEKKKRPK